MFQRYLDSTPEFLSLAIKEFYIIFNALFFSKKKKKVRVEIGSPFGTTQANAYQG